MKRLLTAFLALLVSAPCLFALEYSNSEKIHFLNIGAEGYRSEFEQYASKSMQGYKEKGEFYGGYLKFLTYKPFGDYLMQNTNTFFSFEARYAQSDNIKRDYKGPVGTYTNVGVITKDDCTGGICTPSSVIPSYTPDSQRSREQNVWEIQLTGGQRFIQTQNFDFEGYFGVAFRRHTDKKVDDQIGSGNVYTNMWKIPLGLNLQTHAAGWRLKVNGEFQYLPYVSNKSSSEYLFTGDVPNLGGNHYLVEQNETVNKIHGFGFKLSGDLEKDFGPIGITVSPFFRYTKTRNYGSADIKYKDGGSTLTYLDASGQNIKRFVGKGITTEYGLQLALLF
ncbi:hypothetical protein Dip518_001482 [Parelusimicrobium proximum]|uniref:hypothetical protein n=1 Tax=Parelusimicrobium proximum TaxID=3228953 RepID=UPI003D16499D